MRNISLTKKLLLGLSVVFLAFIIMVTFINFSVFDEKLSPEVAETLEPVKMPPANENAFLAIWGLSASSEKNIVATGEALIARYRENRDKRKIDEITVKDYTEILGGENLDASWDDDYQRCTARSEFGCASKLAKQLSDQPIVDPRLVLLLNRYEQITAMTKFQHMGYITFASPLPPYGVLMKLQRIKIANAYNAENASDFIQRIGKDLRFWKMLLKNGNTLLDKMIAVASVWSDLQVLSEFLKKHPEVTANESRLIHEVLRPLSNQELNISEAFIFEQRAFYNTLNSINPEQLEMAFGLSSRPIFWLMQTNATINDYQQYFIHPINRLSELSSKDFYQAINDKTSCCFQELKSLGDFSPNSLYNLGGKSLLSATLIQGQDYIARVHDLNGLISLVRLQLLLKNIPDESLETSINSSNITNPYTGEPMIYDQENNWLGFECLNEGSFCKVRL
jgi:hypothetical protein